jgi:hypothetical protein
MDTLAALALMVAPFGWLWLIVRRGEPSRFVWAVTRGVVPRRRR